MGWLTAPFARLRILAWVISILLVASALTLFFSASLTVTATPLPDQITVRGSIPPLRFVSGRYFLLPGQYRVSVKKRGYQTLHEDFEVRLKETPHLSYTLTPSPGKVLFDITPSGAAIYVDGALRGDAPIDEALALSSGKHHVSLLADCYAPFRKDIDIEGRAVTQQFRFALLPVCASVQVISAPVAAQVLLDGKLVPGAITPARIRVQSGDHFIAVSLAGHQTKGKKVHVKADAEDTIFSFQLTGNPAVVPLRSKPAQALVELDGVVIGTTPLQLTMSANQTHQLLLSKAKYLPVSRTLHLAPGRQAAINITLSVREGKVLFKVKPKAAELFINGNKQPSANGELKLPAIPHQITIQHHGYAPHVVMITPSVGGGSRLVEVSLKTQEEAREERLTATVTTAASSQVLRLVRPKPFRLGSRAGELGRRANEVERNANMQRPYYLGEREVSNTEYRQFVADHHSGSAGGISLDNGEQPVVGLSWTEAIAYLNWLSVKEGLPPAYVAGTKGYRLRMPVNTGYRLPTEAEWAFVARTLNHDGSKTHFLWGNQLPPASPVANLADDDARVVLSAVLAGYRDGFSTTASVKSFPATGLGFYQLAGNVAEWCHDFYDAAPVDFAEKIDPVGPDSGIQHVIRGSSWRHATRQRLRSQFRDYGLEGRDDVGFRIARYAY